MSQSERSVQIPEYFKQTSYGIWWYRIYRGQRCRSCQSM